MRGKFFLKVALFLAFLSLIEIQILRGAALLGPQAPENVGTVAAIGFSIFNLTGFVIPFEIVGILLLAAMIGAIVLAKEEGEVR